MQLYFILIKTDIQVLCIVFTNTFKMNNLHELIIILLYNYLLVYALTLMLYLESSGHGSRH